MSMICGIHRRTPGPVTGLAAMRAALPGAESATSAAWTDGAAGFGWRGDARLRKDRPGCTPLLDPGPGLAVTASARLDDRSGLCDALDIARGERAALPDSALLLRAYARWGRDCPNHLLGDFAFALWDARRRTLFLARDPVGTRPLLYSLSVDRIVFASDVGAVLAAPGVSDELDEATVAALLAPRPAVLGERTCYRTIRRLPPGHTLTVTQDTVRLDRWWRPENVPAAPTLGDDAVAEAFLALYASAVEDRLRGVGRVGVHLSGGLDSSSVAALATRANRRSGRPLPLTFSWQPPPRDGPNGPAEPAEHALIEAVCTAHGLEPIYCPPDAAGILDYVRRDGTRDLEVNPHEEPVRRAAAGRGVRVLLSGWGGDEGVSFNGRGYEAGLLRRGRFVPLWRFARERSRRPLAAILLRAALPLVWPDAARTLLDLRRGRPPARRRGFAHPGFAQRVRPPPVSALPRSGARETQLHLLRQGHLAERMDGWATSGAQRGIEYAYPLLDRRLLEFALGLPAERYRHGAGHRWLMRHGLRSLLPAEVRLHTSKQDPVRFGAFQAAVAAALPQVRTLLDARSVPPLRSGYLDMPRLRACLDPERHLAAPQYGGLLVALRFLDF
ncbi:MAG: hypothetical protein F4130_12660 [Acidobacteria bacterium]|nr:hypothetical protein [Acidobacteriota bacterium]MYH23124.1 hypothetical protein [Acidobacteriota bacterium]